MSNNLFDNLQNSVSTWLFLLGWLFLIASVFLFCKGKEKLSLALLLVSCLCINSYVALLDPFLNLWDEQFHALVALNLSHNPLKPVLIPNPLLPVNTEIWTSNHIWLHKQPLFLWQMALSIWLLGKSVFAVRLPSIIMNSLLPLLVFRIGKLSFNSRTGYLAALFLGFLNFVFELVSGKQSTDHNDMAFLFYTAASCWALFEYQESKKWKWIIIIGIMAGCAVLVKWLVGLLVFLPWGLLCLFEKQTRLKNFIHLILCVLIAISVFLPWQLYAFYHFPKEASFEMNLNTKHFYEAVENHSGDVWYHFQNFGSIYGNGTFIPVLFMIGFCFLTFATNNWKHRVIMTSIVIVVYLFFSIAATKMLSFPIIAAPFLMIGVAALLDLLLKLMEKQNKFKPALNYLFPAFCMLLAWKTMDPNKLYRKRAEQLDFRTKKLATMQFYQNYKPTKQKQVFYNVFPELICETICFQFFTGCTNFDYIPSTSEIGLMQSKGYQVCILNKRPLPDYIYQNKDIILYNLQSIKVQY